MTIKTCAAGSGRPDVWHQFRQQALTLATTRREFPEWHGGRERFCVWGVLSTCERLQHQVAILRQRLSPYLVTPYPRQPHITVSVCGFWQSPTAAPDDYACSAFASHCEALKGGRQGPFELLVEGINSFSSALFLEVADPDNRLAALRRLLPGYFETIREQAFVPHVTLGVYRDQFACGELAHLLSCIQLEPLVIPVREIVLMSYDTRDIGSPLRVEYRHRL